MFSLCHFSSGKKMPFLLRRSPAPIDTAAAAVATPPFFIHHADAAAFSAIFCYMIFDFHFLRAIYF